MDIIVKYIDELLEKSTPAAPMWNIEKIRQGLKSNWNYIDGVMIKAVLQMYAVSKDEKYLKFADDFIDYRVHEDGTIELQSYDTIVSRCVNGKVEELGKWSQTTTRHQKEFRKQFEC